VTSGNDLGGGRAARSPLDTLATAEPSSSFAPNGGPPDAEVAPVGRRPAARDTRVARDDEGRFPEAVEAEQLVDQARAATEVLEQELTSGSTEGLGWAGLLARVRAAAMTQKAIAESEGTLLELRERAAVEVGAVYDEAAARAEELLLQARSVAAKLVDDARTETAQIRRDAEAGADVVRREAESAATSILGDAERDAAGKRAGADLTLREQIAQAEREASLILEKSHEQASAWLAEAKQACVEMLGRAREEADRMLEAARDETADVLPSVRPGSEDMEWQPVGHRPPTGDVSGRTEAPISRPHRRAIAPGEPVIGSRGSTTAFSGGGEPSDGRDDTAARHTADRRDGRSRSDGRRRRFRS
jgi:hypothetical protein